MAIGSARAATFLAAAVVASACAATPPPATSSQAPWQSIACQSAIGSRPDASDGLGVSVGRWKTDFSLHCVPLSEIRSGGPPRDAIPPLDRPQFYAPELADKWLQPQEPVIAVSEGGEARAYPLQILIWHEIANDTIGGRPITVTFCPLCNTSLVFDRRVEGRELTFGTSGNLRYSDLVMWDRQTESWWQQATGEAIVGALTGKRLQRINALVLSYEEFKRSYPNGSVLNREAANEEARDKTGAGRSYGMNPYGGYDRADSPPIFGFPADALDKRLPPKARVAVATFASPPVAYPIGNLTDAVAINDTVGGRRVVLLFATGVASPLDQERITDGVEIGQAAIFDPTVDGRALTFKGGRKDRTFIDDQTGSSWSPSGLAIAGPLAGSRLAPLDHEVTFWFIWAVFRPDTEVRRPP